MKLKQKIVVAITGASGSIYADVLLTKLHDLRDQYESVSVVLSANAMQVWEHELGKDSYNHPTFKQYDRNDFLAPFASGSAVCDALIIIPCSMGTLGRIATGISNDLITRAADVVLKERKKLICVAREMPYSLVHLNNMKLVTEAGGIICPATPSFYHKPQTVRDVALTVVQRVIDLCGLQQAADRWQQ